MPRPAAARAARLAAHAALGERPFAAAREGANLSDLCVQGRLAMFQGNYGTSLCNPRGT